MIRTPQSILASHSIKHAAKAAAGLGAALVPLLVWALTAATHAGSPDNPTDPHAKIGPEIWREQAVKERINEDVGVRTPDGRKKLLRAGLASRVVDRARVAIYYREKPDAVELQRLKNLGSRVNPNLWIPPIPGKHPYGYIFASVSYAKLISTADDARVVAIRSAEGALKPHNDLAAGDIGADAVREAVPTSYDGSGISIAVIDSSLDVSHPDFPLPIEAYDVTDGDGIANWSTDVSATISDHGTHVTGSALGRGTASAGRYQGIAPGASLYFYKIGNDEDATASWEDIAEAFARAAELEVDIATMSYGGWTYFMDGSEAGSQAVDATVAAGTVVFVSAGNERNTSQHDSVALAGTGLANGEIDIRIDNTQGGGAYTEDVYINVVRQDGAESDDNLALSITNIGLDEALALESYATSIRGTESTFYRLTPQVPAGQSKTYSVELSNSANYGLVAHLYLFADLQVAFTTADPGSTVSEPALADDAIAVGSWVSRAWWWDWQGNFWTWNYAWDVLAPYSSMGPRLDGRIKPDLCAPGSSIISCRDFDQPPPPSWALIDSDGSNDGNGPLDYTIKDGTSMAAPMAAGAAALLLEAYPSLSPDQIGYVLSITADNGSTPNDSMGAGLINILSAVATNCNSNSLPDSLDLRDGLSVDCDDNGQLDECDHRASADCDCSSTIDLGDLLRIDTCPIAPATRMVSPLCTCLDFDRDQDVDLVDYALLQQLFPFSDCNTNQVHDRLDIFYGTAPDCNGNQVPDECDIAGGTSMDAEEDDVPDECRDCNSNGVYDPADIAMGTSDDCNANQTPDECDPDCNNNGSPDDCDLRTRSFADCNNNQVLDSCEPDCNWNDIPDECDLTGGTATDADSDGFPDACVRIVVYLDADAAGLGNGTSWQNAFIDLQAALSQCTRILGAGGEAELWVAAGTYRPDGGLLSRWSTVTLQRGLAIYGGFAGWESARSQRRPELNPTVLSGDLLGNDGANFSNYGDNCYHVVTGNGTDATSILDGFRVQGGYANGSFPHESGGGLLNFTGSPQIRNCTFAGSYANNGGAICNQAGANPIIEDSTFVGNKAVGGGAIMNAVGCNAVIRRCRFESNLADRGGAIRNYECSPTFSDCTFRENHANLHGGAVYAIETGVTRLSNCLIVDNVALSGGGGLYAEDALNLLDGCTFFRNSTSNNLGGGIDISVNATAQVTNSILWANTAVGQTGTVAQLSGSATVTYSCVQGGFTGTGNINSDPKFVTGVLGDYYLSQLAAGQPQNSPCADGASPLSTHSGGTTRTDGIGDAPPRDMGFHYALSDCNENLLPDNTDIAGNTSADCERNGIPDECETDCNANGQADICEIISRMVEDCDENQVPDSCEVDCNSNGVNDVCETTRGGAMDCNGNGSPDDCDVNSGASVDLDSNGTPDECEPAITYLYWTSTNPNRIERCALDGSDRQLISSTAFSRGLCFDMRDDRLYFMHFGSARQIWRTELDGSGANLIYGPLVAEADGLAIDNVHDRLLWCRRTSTTGGIFRVNTDGANFGTLVGSQFTPQSLVVDAYNEHVYWIWQGGVRRANLDGTGVVDVISLPQQPQVYDIAVDPLDQHIYWSIRTVNSPWSLAKIRRCNYDGTGITDLITGIGSFSETPVAVDRVGGKIYWYESDTKRIRRAALDGTGVEDIVTADLAGVKRFALYRKAATNPE